MIDTFRPLIDAARGVDLSQPEVARETLRKRLDPAGAEARNLNSKLCELLAEGKLAERGEMPVKFGRVSKAVGETGEFSIDVVHMDGAGPHHVHPQGEVNWCVALEGAPKFDGEPPGWVVMPPGSGHVPTVAGGRMLVVYLLPGGKIEFTRG